MKKLLGMLGASALLMLGSCANDNFDGPQVPGDEQKGDMFMTMKLSQLSTVGSRTSTPDQGIEIGHDYENKVGNALIIFAKEEDNVYKIFKHSALGVTVAGGDGEYAATFEMNRQDFITDIGNSEEGKTYALFVIANPTIDMVTGCKDGDPVQGVFELEEDGETYWSPNSFLMSSAGKLNEDADEPNHGINMVTIKPEDVALGTHTTASNALNLGSVRIQRAMARFDIETAEANIVFEANNDKSDLKDIKVIIDGFALVNQATSANLYKVTGSNALTFTQSSTLNFTSETAENWVWSDKQTAFTLPLFGTGEASNGSLTGTKVDVQGLQFTKLSEILKNDQDNTFTHTGNSQTQNGSYYIWRYCMENTNPAEPKNQFNGNSTGIIFRARMECQTITEDGAENVAIYAYNNVFLGKAESLRSYVTNKLAEDGDANLYQMVKIHYYAAIDEYNKKQEDATKIIYGDQDKEGTEATGIRLSQLTAEQLAALDTYLVGEEFSIYRPTMAYPLKEGSYEEDTSKDKIPVYYSYYSYWNRHNDNGDSTQMGVMEFATVRNNVYKIKVTKIHKLGHPGETKDDPDPETPPTPDESDHFYISVACEILPWEVRMNEVEL